MVSMISKEVRKIWEDHEEEFCGLIRIPSVYDESTVSSKMPCGEAVHRAYQYMMKICADAGLTIREYDNRVFCASLGEGERVDIASHLDVVEPGNGWTHDPFGADRENGRIYGRGTQDMKSGGWAAFLALLLLKESKVPLKREFRLVFGTDEERTMDDMKHYLHKAGRPGFAFSPDCEFPLYYGEKGALMWTLSGRYSGKIKHLTAGVQCNVVSPHAEAELRDGTFISKEGKAAHASRPEEGKSATVALLKELREILPDDNVITRLYGFFEDAFGQSAGIAKDVFPVGALTMNLGILSITDEGDLSAQIDVRYPAGVSSDKIFKVFSDYFSDLSPEMPYDDPPTMADPDDPHIKALQKAYEEVVGNEPELRISGGVSYAKVFGGNCVTFGPVPENAEKLAHQRDEWISVDACLQATEIYYKSFLKLNEI